VKQGASATSTIPHLYGFTSRGVFLASRATPYVDIATICAILESTLRALQNPNLSKWVSAATTLSLVQQSLSFGIDIADFHLYLPV
jgi:hypothetical protein